MPKFVQYAVFFVLFKERGSEKNGNELKNNEKKKCVKKKDIYEWEMGPWPSLCYVRKHTMYCGDSATTAQNKSYLKNSSKFQFHRVHLRETRVVNLMK